MRTFALAAVAFFITGISHAAGNSLCTASEQTLFACSIGKKIASICIPLSTGGAEPRLRYVFGSPGTIELSIPDSRALATTRSSVGSIAYSGGSTIYHRFSNGAYEYIVYTNQGHSYAVAGDPDSIRGWLKEGVLVAKDNSVVANLPCRNSTPPGSAWLEVDGSILGKLPPASDPDIERVEGLLTSVDLERALTRRSSGTRQKRRAP